MIESIKKYITKNLSEGERYAQLAGDVMYKRRKWSRIHKVKHRNKKAVNKEIK